jgi:hypothetical protein
VREKKVLEAEKTEKTMKAEMAVREKKSMSGEGMR